MTTTQKIIKYLAIAFALFLVISIFSIIFGLSREIISSINSDKKDSKLLEENDIHIHFPEGAINKDGPSAGITITTALISLLRQEAVEKSISMTGEITLRGRVLAIGGLKEKVIGSHRAGIKTIFIPRENEKDLKEIPKEVSSDIEFILVESYEEIAKKLFHI